MAASGNRLDDRIAELADRFKLPDTAASKLRALAELVSGDEHAPTTVTKPERIIDEHFADSLIALELAAVRGASAIADLGAGAGFPGLPLALALPDARVQLVESNARKCAFIAKAVASCAIENAEVVQTRAETWPEGVGAADVVTARALATLEVVAEYAAPLLRLGGIAVAWRGQRDPVVEAAAARAAAELGLDLAEPRPVTPFAGARHRHLHVMSKVRQTPSRFPRRAGMARKRPLGHIRPAV